MNADCNASKNILQYDTWLPDQKARLSLWTIESLSVSCENKSIRSPVLQGGVHHRYAEDNGLIVMYDYDPNVPRNKEDNDTHYFFG